MWAIARYNWDFKRTSFNILMLQMLQKYDLMDDDNVEQEE